MKRKKVLILGKLPPPYMGPSIGTEIMLRSKLNEDFELIHLNTKANHSIETLGKWRFNKLFKNIRIYYKMIRLISKHKPDIALIPISQKTLGYLKDSVFLILAASFNTKTVIHFLGGDFKERVDASGVLMKKYIRYTLQLSEGAIVLGNNLKYHFEDFFTSENIYIIPNGADYQFPLPEKKTDDKLRIIYLSNMLPAKGIEDILQALAILKKNYETGFIFKITGSWRDSATKKKCLSIIETNTLPVIFSPPEISNEEKLKHLVNSDLFVFTPRAPEGQPWAISEAMAAGLPIISTNSGAITESVIDGENGYIVQKNAPNQIAEKIKYLIEHPDLRKKMGDNSRKKYLENLTEEKMVEKFRICFNSIINS